MSKNIYGRRMERVSIDGKIHLVKTRWLDPGKEITHFCPFCRSPKTKPMMDIIQRGIENDRVRTYFLCQECDHCVEYRYTVECFGTQELSV